MDLQQPFYKDKDADSAAGQVKPPVEVPFAALSEDALRGVIDSFIQREGTDYGSAEVSYEAKVKQVTAQILGGAVRIIFDPNFESITLMTTLEWKKYSSLSN